VKKALDKAKQSPFKKRGNFEEEATTIVPYPKSDSKDYSHSDLPKQLMAKMFGLLKEGLFCDKNGYYFDCNKENNSYTKCV
jgi:hypothetical protein